MKVIAAYALLALSGKKDITAADVKGVLSSVQANASDDDINRFIASVKGKTIHQLIAEGTAKIGGAGSAPVQAAKETKKEAPKKEEPKKKQQPKKKEEPKEEEEDGGMGGLFD